jgi:Zinc finger, C3HC4 type (RING finger)
MESSSNDILKQVATLDDADVWKQQLITCLDGGITASVATANRGPDVTSCDADSKIDPNEDNHSESTSKEGLLSTMNQIGNALHDLECYMRCHHCASLFHAPVVVDPCHHIFCSYCIRNKFHYDRNISTVRKASCPLCKCLVDASGFCYDRCLRPHRQLDLFVHTFREIRQPLLKALKEEHQRILDSTDSEPKRVSNVKLPSVLLAVQNAICYLEQITKRSKSDTAPQLGPLNVPQIVHPILLHAGNIPYPMLPHAVSKPRDRLPSAFYNGKTKKQLVELCADVGISTYGISNDEAALKKRHFDFISFYNAECDSLLPRSKTELIKIFEQQQSNVMSSQSRKTAPSTNGKGSSELQRNLSKFSGCTDYAVCMNALKLQRKRLGESPYPTKFWSSVTTGYRQFDLEMAENFQKLIAQYYSRFPDQLQKQTERIQRFRDSRPLVDSKQHGPSNVGTPVDHSSAATTQEQETLQPTSADTKVASILPNLPGDGTNGDISTSSAFNHSAIPRRTSIVSESIRQRNAIKSILYRGVNPTNGNDPHTSTVRSHFTVCQANAEHINDASDLRQKTSLTVNMNHRGTPVTICSSKNEQIGDSNKRRSLANGANISKKAKDSLTTQTRSSQRTVVVDTSSLIGPWICTYCTYCNTKDRSTRARCEMCSNVRVPPKHQRSSSSTGTVIEIDC